MGNYFLKMLQLLLQLMDLRSLRVLKLPDLLLFLVEPLGHLRKLFVLLDHNIPQTVILHAQVLEVACVLFLLEQHFLHFQQLGVLLIEDFEEFVVLVLQVVEVVELPAEGLRFQLPFRQGFFALEKAFFELLVFLLEDHLFPVALEEGPSHVFHLSLVGLFSVADPVVAGTDCRGVHSGRRGGCRGERRRCWEASGIVAQVADG